MRTLARLICTIAVVALLGFCPLSARAQDEPDYQHVWVHYDYMVFPPGWTSPNLVTYPNGLSMAPSPAAIEMVVDAFAKQGITLHIDPIHNALPGHLVTIPDYYPWWPATQACVGSDAVGILALRKQYFQPQGDHPWHYAVFGYNVGLPDTVPDGNACGRDPVCGGPPDPTATGNSELPGFNFILALGTLSDLTGIPLNLIPDITAGAIFMHELGHNFGLEHGGVHPLRRAA